ncbi:MAG: DinB family protein [Flavobacteriales bacterium]|nr:DinB family protein [Flavobacteriales bacterium]
MATRKQLLKHFDKMEAERQELLSAISSYSDQLLSKKPAPESWSVAEVMEHLTVAENGSLQYMHKKIEYGGHSKAAITAGLKQQLLNFSISLPIKYKVPKILEKKDTSFVDYKDALNNWNEVRIAMRSAYEKMDEGIIGNELFKHPFAGKMNVIQGVKFMRQHMKHHTKQIHSTLKRVG